MIEITPAAMTEVIRMMSLGAVDTNLYLTLGTGGCEQFYYQLSLTTVTNQTDLTIQVGDFQVSIDSQYSQYLKNLQIDFSQDLMGGGFRFQNPQATKVCGCGNAFSV
jgi:iron-sulfur cluster assembly protein